MPGQKERSLLRREIGDLDCNRLAEGELVAQRRKVVPRDCIPMSVQLFASAPGEATERKEARVVVVVLPVDVPERCVGRFHQCPQAGLDRGRVVVAEESTGTLGQGPFVVETPILLLQGFSPTELDLAPGDDPADDPCHRLDEMNIVFGELPLLAGPKAQQTEYPVEGGNL